MGRLAGADVLYAFCDVSILSRQVAGGLFMVMSGPIRGSRLNWTGKDKCVSKVAAREGGRRRDVKLNWMTCVVFLVAEAF